jgi:hypothetical protein
MATPNIHYRLYVDKNISKTYPSIILLTGHPLEYYSTLSMMIDYFQNLELFGMGKVSPLLLALNHPAIKKLKLFISGDTINSCKSFMHKFCGTIYVFDTKKNIIYETNIFFHQIATIANSLPSDSKGRLGFCHLTTEIARYVWYRLFFSNLSHIYHTDASKRELLAYLNHKTGQPREQ